MAGENEELRAVRMGGASSAATTDSAVPSPSPVCCANHLSPQTGGRGQANCGRCRASSSLKLVEAFADSGPLPRDGGEEGQSPQEIDVYVKSTYCPMRL